MAKRQISEERKVLYYIGMGVTAIGVILFLSVFVRALNPSSMLDDMVSGNPMASFMGPPLIGFIMIAVGNVLRTIAARGAYGSGLMLDPEKAREDLAPWSSMAGGVIKDALEEVNIASSKEAIKEVIKIRCPHCTALNDENSKYCGQCGQKMI